MKRLIAILATLSLFIISMATLVACNDHGVDGDVVNNDNTNNVTQQGDVQVETLSPKKTALWLELEDGDYDFALARNHTASDPDLIGHQVGLPSGLAAMVVTGEDQLILEADDLVEVWEVTDIGQFEMLVRNLWTLPSGWQPDLFPTTEGEAADLEILMSAFICGQGLDLYSRGCQGQIPFSLFRKVGETSYYEWTNQSHAKYVFVIKY